MQIVRASKAQLSDALVLLHEYYEAINVQKRDAPGEIEGYLSDAASGCWIAYVDGKPAGCVVLRPIMAIEPEPAWECKRLYVRPPFRGRGIAERLLTAMEDYASTIGAQWIYLDSKDDLPDALRIYRRRAYQDCERYNDNPQATVFLRKRLGV